VNRVRQLTRREKNFGPGCRCHNLAPASGITNCAAVVALAGLIATSRSVLSNALSHGRWIMRPLGVSSSGRQREPGPFAIR
jgi:hypothetical protein